MTAPTIVADFIAQTCTINGAATPITDHWQQSPDYVPGGALQFSGAGLITDMTSDAFNASAPSLIPDCGMAQAAGTLMAAGCIVEQTFNVSAMSALKEDPYEYIMFDYWGDSGTPGAYFGFNLVNLGASYVWRWRNSAGILIDNVPADLSDTVAQWRFENGVLVSATIDGGSPHTAVPASEAWGSSNSNGNMWGFNEQEGFASAVRSTSLITFTPLIAPSRPFQIKVGLIPARVGTSGL